MYVDIGFIQYAGLWFHCISFHTDGQKEARTHQEQAGTEERQETKQQEIMKMNSTTYKK